MRGACLFLLFAVGFVLCENWKAEDDIINLDKQLDQEGREEEQTWKNVERENLSQPSRTLSELKKEAERIRSILEKERANLQKKIEETEAKKNAAGISVSEKDAKKYVRDIEYMTAEMSRISSDLFRADKAFDTIVKHERIAGNLGKLIGESESGMEKSKTFKSAEEADKREIDDEVASVERQSEISENRRNWKLSREEQDRKLADVDSRKNYHKKDSVTKTTDAQRAATISKGLASGNFDEQGAVSELRKKLETQKAEVEELERDVQKEISLLREDRESLRALTSETSIINQALKNNADAHDKERAQLSKLKTAVYGELIIGATLIVALSAAFISQILSMRSLKRGGGYAPLESGPFPLDDDENDNGQWRK